jgi:hypothetical protein
MTPERLLTAAEHQALELIESRLERDDRRLAARLGNAFERRSWPARALSWLEGHSWGAALVTAVVLMSAGAFPAGGAAFGTAVTGMALAAALVLVSTTVVWRAVVRARRLVPND